MQSTYLDIHQSFKLKGISYGIDELKQLAYSFIKEGSGYEFEIGDFLLQWLDSEPTLQVKTSGSTGKPKLIELQKKHMVNSAMATGDFFNLKANTTALLCLSAEYIAGKMMLVRAMVLGWDLDYVAPNSNPLIGISKSYDFCAMVPLQLENSLNQIEQLKTLIVGGATISQNLKTRIEAKSTNIFETYGMTETATHVAVKAVSSSAVENNFNALPNVVFSVDDRECLCIQTQNVAIEPIQTNDIVNLISETVFEWLGRYDNVINSGGVKLFPEQIESKLEPLITSRFFVAGQPDEKLGQKLVLVIEGNLDIEKLRLQLNRSIGLERFEIPKNIYVLTNFVETDSGKIHRSKTLALI